MATPVMKADCAARRRTSWGRSGPGSCSAAARHVLRWRRPQFPERFVVLRREIGRRYRRVDTVAGCHLMIEPVTGAPAG
ncbi:MAG: hypothetical protein ACK2UB_11335 [Anaerolineales bacterium]|jgi:hypothetical protein